MSKEADITGTLEIQNRDHGAQISRIVGIVRESGLDYIWSRDNRLF
jgi:hypothetical protein